MPNNTGKPMNKTGKRINPRRKRKNFLIISEEVVAAKLHPKGISNL